MERRFCQPKSDSGLIMNRVSSLASSIYVPTVHGSDDATNMVCGSDRCLQRSSHLNG
jgi:hypothetical protein